MRKVFHSSIYIRAFYLIISILLTIGFICVFILIKPELNNVKNILGYSTLLIINIFLYLYPFGNNLEIDKSFIYFKIMWIKGGKIKLSKIIGIQDFFYFGFFVIHYINEKNAQLSSVIFPLNNRNDFIKTILEQNPDCFVSKNIADKVLKKFKGLEIKDIR
jgi:hypothetical protein